MPGSLASEKDTTTSNKLSMCSLGTDGRRRNTWRALPRPSHADRASTRGLAWRKGKRGHWEQRPALALHARRHVAVEGISSPGHRLRDGGATYRRRADRGVMSDENTERSPCTTAKRLPDHRKQRYASETDMWPPLPHDAANKATPVASRLCLSSEVGAAACSHGYFQNPMQA